MYMMELQKKQLITFFKKNREIKLVYLFGSHAKGTAGPLSDYDIAVYIDSYDTQKLISLKFALIREVTAILKTDAVDIVILNTCEQPELKYAIITEGILLYEKLPYKMLVEPKILNEYFDFRMILERHGLTHVS